MCVRLFVKALHSLVVHNEDVSSSKQVCGTLKGRKLKATYTNARHVVCSYIQNKTASTMLEDQPTSTTSVCVAILDYYVLSPTETCHLPILSPPKTT